MPKKRASRPPISREFADRFSRKLEQLPAKKKTTLTTKELIAENVHQLVHLLKNGYSYDDLIIVLKEDGISLTKPTLRQYLNAAKKVQSPASKPGSRHTPHLTNTAVRQPLELDADQKSGADGKRSQSRLKGADSYAAESEMPPSKKLGRSRLQSDENPTRYPDGHGQPIEMKTDL